MSDVELERRVRDALHAPVALAAGGPARVMERVRATPASLRPRRSSRTSRRGGSLHSLVGLALAAGIGSVATMASLPAARSAVPTVASAVIGDSVVGTLRDTLRLVRLMLDAPSATRVSLVGDFNGWRDAATPMHRISARRWSVTIALRDGEHRYAVVVDGTRQLPRTEHDAGHSDAGGRGFALLRVARRID